MANMYATHSYMPYVEPIHKRQAAKKKKSEKASKVRSNASPDLKTYKVTLRDRGGFTYTYIIQADPSSRNNMPILCESRVAAPRHLATSLRNMSSPESMRQALLGQGKEDLTKVDDGEKKGLINSIISFIKRKTSSSKSSSSKQQMAVKSKRKLRPMFPKKRQRTISARSNLDPIFESPEEDDDFDTDSYTHDSNDSASLGSSASDHDGSEL